MGSLRTPYLSRLDSERFFDTMRLEEVFMPYTTRPMRRLLGAITITAVAFWVMYSIRWGVWPFVY